MIHGKKIRLVNPLREETDANVQQGKRKAKAERSLGLGNGERFLCRTLNSSASMKGWRLWELDVGMFL